MFKVSLSQLIFIYLSLPLAILFVLWFLKEKEESKHLEISEKPEELALECPFCQNVFIHSKKEDIIQCPLCENYFKKNS